MENITLTEAELQAKINEAVDLAKQELIAKHNGEMATMRKENKDLKNANLSAEEKKAQELEELKQANEKELAELRTFKRTTEISNRLAKEKLPSYLVNDSRLLNSTAEDFEKNLKQVKADYEATQPKGNTHSSVVSTATSGATPNDAKSDAFAKMGDALKIAIGK